MAEESNKCGSSPYVIKGWQDYVKLKMLDEMYATGKPVRELILSVCQFNENRLYIYNNYNHEMQPDEARVAIMEMYVDEWIEPAEYVCDCCKHIQWQACDVLKHVIAFKLTKDGFKNLHEHILP